MSLVRLSNPNPFPFLSSAFDNFFDDENRWLKAVSKGQTVPAVNIKETDEEYTLDLAAPGKGKDDFKISVKDNVLSISSEKEESSETNEGNYTRKEYSFSSFERSFNLPKNTSTDVISATYDNGILHVTIPKEETEVDSGQEIKVK